MDQHGEELVCKVLKSIYGLKQAPRNWNKTVSAWLVEFGFKQSTVDPCIYIFAAGGDLYILALYVDASIMAGPPGSFISDFKRAFGKRFNVQDLGPVSWLLGMTVERDRAAGVLKVGQRQYILNMLERFNMSDCKAVSTPMTVGALSEATASEVLSPDVPYQSLIGSLLYATVSQYQARHHHGRQPSQPVHGLSFHCTLGASQASASVPARHSGLAAGVWSR